MDDAKRMMLELWSQLESLAIQLWVVQRITNNVYVGNAVKVIPICTDVEDANYYQLFTLHGTEEAFKGLRWTEQYDI